MQVQALKQGKMLYGKPSAQALKQVKMQTQALKQEHMLYGKTAGQALKQGDTLYRKPSRQNLQAR
jgi:hypothetical protein